MAALQSLSPAVRNCIANPVLVIVAAAFALLQMPQLLVQQPEAPLLAAGVSLLMSGLLLVVLPFYQGGILGMADEARNADTSLSTFLAVGKTNYVSLLLAYLLLIALIIGLGIVAVGVLILGGIGRAHGRWLTRHNTTHYRRACCYRNRHCVSDGDVFDPVLWPRNRVGRCRHS